MIEINNLTNTRTDEKFFKKVVHKVLKNEKKNKIDLSIALVGLKKIKELNRKYRRKNRPTDVLSFLYDNSGEIVICPEVVKKNAKKNDLTFKKELTRVLIHGILHVLGEDHEKSKKEAGKMAKKETFYLEKIF